MGKKQDLIDDQLSKLDWARVLREAAAKDREMGHEAAAVVHEATAKHIEALEGEIRRWRLRDRVERASMN